MCLRSLMLNSICHFLIFIKFSYFIEFFLCLKAQWMIFWCHTHTIEIFLSLFAPLVLFSYLTQLFLLKFLENHSRQSIEAVNAVIWLTFDLNLFFIEWLKLIRDSRYVNNSIAAWANKIVASSKIKREEEAQIKLY